MCRLTAYIGEPILMADLVSRPRRSVVRQSFDAKERLCGDAANLNGDGFGIGWYMNGCEEETSTGGPCVFKSVTPAWSNGNLARISQFIKSHILFAHVRAATVGNQVSESGCHPFHYGRLLWMHNGEVAGFGSSGVRRKILSLLDDKLFTLALENGTTDTSVCFSLFLSLLGPDAESKTPLAPMLIRQKLEETIRIVCNVVEECGIKAVSMLNFVVADGSTIVASRFVHHPLDSAVEPASLYFTSGTQFKQIGEDNSEYHMVRADRQERMAIIASEPLTDNRVCWVKVPCNCTLTITANLSIVLKPLSLYETPKATNPTDLTLLNSLSWNSRAGPVHTPHKTVATGPSSMHKLTGHKDTIMSLVVGHGKSEGLFFSGAQDSKIRAWNIKKQDCVGVMCGHTGSVLSLEFSSDLDMLFSASSDSKVIGWHCPGFTAAFSTNICGAGDILSVAVRAGELFLGCRDTSIRVIRLASIPAPGSPAIEILAEKIPMKREQSLPFGYVYCMAVAGEFLCTGGGEGGVWLWSCESGRLHKVLTGHSSAVLCLEAEKEIVGGMSPSWTLFSGSQDCTVRIWDMETLSCRRTIGHFAPVLSLALSPSLLFIGGSNGVILACERTLSYRFMFQLVEGNTSIQTLAYMNDGTLICGSVDVRQWPGTVLTRFENQILSEMSRVAVENDIFISPEYSSPQTKTLVDVQTPREISRSLEDNMVVTLAQYVAIKSVSDPHHGLKDECWRAAKVLQSHLRQMGAATTLHCGKEGVNPLVLGRIGEDKKKPTVVVYGHYDVHPATGSKWTTDPWTLTGIDGYLYGRGTTDDKGPIVATLSAVESLLEKGGVENLPVNIVFAFEGEEESGSGGFEESISDCIDWFDGTVAIICSNSYWIDDERPCITYGMRGALDVSIEISGPKQDLHSGIDGGAVVCPIHDLVSLCSTLTGPEGTAAVPGFLDDVRPVTALDKNCYDAISFDTEKYGEKVGVAQPHLRSGTDALIRRWHAPSISISEIVCSNTTHSFSVVPRHATAKLSIRFVPDQNSETLLRHLNRHVQHFMSMRGSPNTAVVKPVHAGDWWLTDINGAVFAAAESSIEKVWGVKPLRVREGGTMPITRFLETTLHAPAIHIPLGQASDGAHLANERIRLLNLLRGKQVMEHTLVNIGAAYDGKHFVSPSPSKIPRPSSSSSSSDDESAYKRARISDCA